MGGVNTILQANNKTHVARAEWRAAVANTANKNRVESSKSNLANFMRTFANQTRVEAASKEFNFQMDQLSEEVRNAQGASLNSQLQLATARGALSAQAGMVGVGGSSVDLMDTMVRLQEEMDVETKDNAAKLLASRGASKTAQIMSNAYGSIDLTQTFGQYDFQEYIEPQRMKRRLGKLIGVAVATYFGGPQAGEAMADFAVGTWQASNGDFDGSGQSFGQAASGALAAYKQWGERGGQAWGASVAEGMGGRGGEATVNWGAFDPDSSKNAYGTQTSGYGWF